MKETIIPSHHSELDADNSFLPLLPLKNVVILPKSIIPIIVGRQSSIQAVEYALKHDRTIFITAQKDQKIESPTEQDVYQYGTKSTILQVMRMPNDALKILAEGISRARITKTENIDGFMAVWCEDLPTTSMEKTVEVEATWRQLQSLYTSYSKLNEKAPADLAITAKNTNDMDYIADTIAVHITNLPFDERQKILETPDLAKRMLALCTLLKNEIEILQTEQRIRGRVQTQVEKSQREYYLGEQMKAIQKELGREDQSAELDAIRTKIKTLGMPKEAYEKVEKELKRLEQMPPLSSEAVVSRNYVDWLTTIPWKKVSKDSISLPQAEEILDRNHAGLKKAKERIIEFIAAKKFSEKFERSPIICLVGPPGVGKTSLGESIAQSLGRDFVRISLGGIRDEAEIRGHRRTYIGALPGKIVQAIRKAGTVNPVILLDEIDKMSRDMHGDPAAALLEVLDPEQNRTFVDHFLDTEYDLSKVMFIATANMMDGIPYPLFDRLEIINLSGYTDDEKVEIAHKFLVPKNLKSYGLTKTQFKISDEILRSIIVNYTREAGVRQLERVITKLMRKTIQVLLKDKKTKSITITPDNMKEWLGYPTARKTSLSTTTNKIGIATGLAWTEVGGDVLEIETTVISGKGALTLTGQLGEVMQESAHAALSYIRSRATELGLKGSFYTTKDIHIHIPEGATPKDGPSAGITICVALVSALTNNPIANDLVMTGEITLQGRVLAVGGLKEKLLAAKQHGFKRVFVPQENFDDVQEILKEIEIGDIEIVFMSNMDEVLAQAFVKNPFVKPVVKNAELSTKKSLSKKKKKVSKPVSKVKPKSKK
ncbi:MAG: endopeptidase La [Candidatus Babeliales bacterium]|nr:endopeptidase La [Candidatus Babeliales bacterium]